MPKIDIYSYAKHVECVRCEPTRNSSFHFSKVCEAGVSWLFTWDYRDKTERGRWDAGTKTVLVRGLRGSTLRRGIRPMYSARRGMGCQGWRDKS